MEISNSSKEDAPPSATMDTTMHTCSASSKPINLLSPPKIVATGNIATGAKTDTLCKQNRRHRDKALAQQPVVSQWIIHQGNMILLKDHWVGRQNTAEKSEMALQGLAIHHEAADVLTDWKQFDCIRNSTMSLTTLVLCFFISQICFWDHKYVLHLCKVFYHLVKVILNLVASMFLPLCHFHTSSHVPQEMSHMASLVYYKFWDFRIFFVLYRIFFKFIMFYSKCAKRHTCFFLFV
jgi:hypothetical protein